MTINTLEPRLTEVGGVPIARLLPSKGKQPIGAWCLVLGAFWIMQARPNFCQMTQVYKLVVIHTPIYRLLVG